MAKNGLIMETLGYLSNPQESNSSPQRVRN